LSDSADEYRCVERRKTPRYQSASPNGCTDALMMAHGFEVAMPGKLVIEGLAKAEEHNTKAGHRRMKVLHITAANRKAIPG
jgi:hypothetical protein